jgi:hypothetical protein
VIRSSEDTSNPLRWFNSHARTTSFSTVTLLSRSLRRLFLAEHRIHTPTQPSSHFLVPLHSLLVYVNAHFRSRSLDISAPMLGRSLLLNAIYSLTISYIIIILRSRRNPCPSTVSSLTVNCYFVFWGVMQLNNQTVCLLDLNLTIETKWVGLGSVEHRLG